MQEQKKDLILVADYIFTGRRDQVIKEAAVHIRDGIVTAVGTASELLKEYSFNCTVIHLPKNASILPGLVDGHAQLSFSGRATPYRDVMLAEKNGSLATDIDSRARELALSGITSLRDPGSVDFHLPNRIRPVSRSTSLISPQVFNCGPPLVADHECSPQFGEYVSTPEEVEQAVVRRVKQGADFISYRDREASIVPGGPDFKSSSQFTLKLLKTIVKIAQRHGVKVAATVHSSASIRNAIAAEVAVIDRCRWPDVNDWKQIKNDAEEMANRGISACIPIDRNPLALIDKYGSSAVSKYLFDLLHLLNDSDVLLLVGSGTGSVNSWLNDYVSTLQGFSFAGFERGRIIELATRVAGEIVAGTGKRGNIAPGYAADLVVVDGFPLEEISVLRNILMVICSGFTIVNNIY